MANHFQKHTGDNGVYNTTVNDFKSTFCYGKKSWAWLLASFVFLVITYVSAIGLIWKERVRQYDKGEIKKVVTYRVKSIDGDTMEKDSTYTYKLIR